MRAINETNPNNYPKHQGMMKALILMPWCTLCNLENLETYTRNYIWNHFLVAINVVP